MFYAVVSLHLHEFASHSLFCLRLRITSQSRSWHFTLVSLSFRNSCNNPMTKEPKIEAGKRIVSEWSALDAEARALVDRLRAQDEEDEAKAKLSNGSGQKSGALNADSSSSRSHDEL